MKKKIVWSPNTLILVLVGLLFSTLTAYAAGTITLDGNFDDWVGQPCVTDPIGDASTDANDLTDFCFVSDQVIETVCFMVGRVQDTNRPLNTVIYIDGNGDGDYTDLEDRSIEITYNPNQNNSRVTVDVYDGQGTLISNVASNADWGEEGNNGASKVEACVSFADLGVVPGSTVAISMYAVSMQGSAIDDGTAEIQWTPANALGRTLIAVILIIGTYVMVKAARKRNMQQIK